VGKHDRLEERISKSLVGLIRIYYIMRNRSGKGAKSPPFDPQYYILGFLMKDGLPISEIGRRLQRSKPNMTALINRLIKEGKVRKSQDARDKRISRITITNKGREAMERRTKEVMGCIKQNLAPLERKDLERLCESLETVNEIARKCD
jgi:DNA-binding MarR family transcriptional regulator